MNTTADTIILIDSLKDEDRAALAALLALADAGLFATCATQQRNHSLTHVVRQCFDALRDDTAISR